MNRHLILTLGLSRTLVALAYSPETGSGAAETLSEPVKQPIHGEPVSGATGKQAMVHKKDAEGILLIDAVTGFVLPEQHDRPEWSDGLSLAQFSERHAFYTSRLGNDLYSAEMRVPELYAYEDLSWLGVITDVDSEEAGNETVIEADYEHRAEVLASVLGIERDADKNEELGFNAVTGALAEIEISRDYHRTGEDMAAFTESQQAASLAEWEKGLKTGTEG